MIESGIFTLLSTDANIAAILGTSRSDKTKGVFPNIAPDEVVLPYLVYQEIHRESFITYGGVNRFQGKRLQFSCFGSTYLGAKTLAKAVKDVLDGYTGTLSDGTFIGNTIPNSEHDEIEPSFKATIYSVILDYNFMSVDNAMSPGPQTQPLGSVPIHTSSYVAQQADDTILMESVSPLTLTLAINIIADRIVHVKNLGTGALTIQLPLGSSALIDGQGSIVLIHNQAVDLLWDGVNYWIL